MLYEFAQRPQRSLIAQPNLDGPLSHARLFSEFVLEPREKKMSDLVSPDFEKYLMSGKALIQPPRQAHA